MTPAIGIFFGLVALTLFCAAFWVGKYGKVRRLPSDDALLIAFVQGAKWECYRATGATMWQSDQHDAMSAAMERLENGTLGKQLP